MRYDYMQKNKKNLLDRKDLERMLSKDKRQPIRFVVEYVNFLGKHNSDDKKVIYKDFSMIQWKRGIVRCTVQFDNGQWVWHGDELAKHDSKKVRKK